MIAAFKTTDGRDDAGFSLVEQIVTVSILGLVLAVVMSFLINATLITGRADANVRAEQDGLTALRTVTEDVRSVKTLSACSTLTFDKCVNLEISKATTAGATCPKRVVSYFVSGTDLKQVLTEYAANCTVLRSGTRTLLANVQSTSIFTFYAADGVTPLNLNVANDLAKVPAAPAMKVSVDVKYRQAAKNVTLSSLASLRNNR